MLMEKYARIDFWSIFSHFSSSKQQMITKLKSKSKSKLKNKKKKIDRKEKRRIKSLDN